MTTYVIPLFEEYLDLIEVLIGGRPAVNNDGYVIIVTAIPPILSKNHQIVLQETLFDKNGDPKNPNLIWL